MFSTVLIANRGEIAVRVTRTLRRLGIRSVAIFTEADAMAGHVRAADIALPVGSYLDIAEVVAAAVASGAQAIHPGYGFLSENAAFARACADAGVVFVGPGVHALEVMGDKIAAKQAVEARGVPTVPGSAGSGLDDAALTAAAAEIGYPLLVKPSAGGGGKGMQVVRSEGELAAALASARRVSAAAFGDDTLLLERLIETPRHIEVQVLADAAGTTIHLGERECSLQRRHQKVIEEAPSPLLDAATRARIGEAACEVARSVEYRGAGTVEFLVADAAPDEFFFIEMNTRLQVEHPVTEEVTGIDLVEQQLRIAAGEPLTLGQDDIGLTGHAIEARIYAESPARGFLPATGTVLALHAPAGAGWRLDSGLVEGQVVGAGFDPMLAKAIGYGADRAEALARLDALLADTVVLGVDTNIDELRSILADEAVEQGRLDTGLLDRRGTPAPAEPDDRDLAVAAALAAHDRTAYDRAAHDRAAAPAASGPWRLDGWRAGGATPASADVTELTPHRYLVDGETVWAARDAASRWLRRAGRTVEVPEPSRADRVAAMLAGLEREQGPVSPEVRSQMPGTVVAVPVRDGDAVEAGDTIVAVEAMKMEHALTAPVAGIVRVDVAVGDQVRRDQVVAHIEGSQAPEESTA
ncbi:MAG TPA: biotin carboxylase N-terminal domain-containing protein [Pseudolysinimonas sp.]|jgi:acetyl-CoA/propionyl-CoA carboxylase biotin carboxyl carrier protein|nr:biotin carboxylase N-terminal domain-containing protein [Pseudolysinimonas sp.]